MAALTLTWNPTLHFQSGYMRSPYQWNYQYGYNVPFVPPINADPRTHHLFYQGSQIFRHFDKDWNGRMSHSEFRKALNHTGYAVPEWEADRLFYLVDTDRSGKITEMEFVEFWVYAHGGAPSQITTTTTTYGASPMGYGSTTTTSVGYGAPAMGYGAASPAMPMASPMPMANPSTMSLAWNPQYLQTYQRHPYQWNYTYGYNVPFMPPLNSDPRTHHLWYQASQIFRHFDKDWNGRMSHHEFRKALNHTGYSIPEWEADRLFYLVDTDRSGKITEMEFAEFWVYAHGGSPFHLQGYQTTTTTTTTAYGAQPGYGMPGAPMPGYGGGVGVQVGGFGASVQFNAAPGY